MARLSAHFDSREFACKHCGRLPAGKPPYSLLAALEKARTRHYPKGMVIRSGYRPLPDPQRRRGREEGQPARRR